VARSTDNRITLADEPAGRSRPARVVTIDREHDLAVLKIDRDKPLPYLRLGRSDDLMIGETVIAIGNPLGYQHTVTTGVIGALNRTLKFSRDVKYEGLMQTDAAINPGNSGGPLLNINGELIGISTAIRGDAQNIGFGLELKGVKPKEIKRQVEEIMEVMTLTNLYNRRPDQLSGGQQQRVALARAIINRPKVLLFDEPLSNLDAKLRDQMRIEIRRIQQSFGITTIYVTHDQDEAMTVSDRIMVMKDGEVMQIGTPFEIYSRPANTFVADFIGRVNLIDAVVETVKPETISVVCGGGGEHRVNTAFFNIIVMCRNGIVNDGVFAVFAEKITADYRMGTFNFVIDGFAKIVEKADAFGGHDVQVEVGSHHRHQRRHLDGVVEHVLFIAGAIF